MTPEQRAAIVASETPAEEEASKYGVSSRWIQMLRGRANAHARPTRRSRSSTASDVITKIVEGRKFRSLRFINVAGGCRRVATRDDESLHPALFAYRGRRIQIRRLVFVGAHGRVPIGLRPSCGNEWCVAAKHLTEITREEVWKRMDNAKRKELVTSGS